MELTYRGTKYYYKSFQTQNYDTLGWLDRKYSTIERGFLLFGKYRGVLFYAPSPTIVSRCSLLAYKYRGVNYIKQSICDRK